MRSGVIEIMSGDLVRWGEISAEDWTCDPAMQTVRSDVPDPAYRKGQPGEQKMSRWTGTAWILVNQI